MMRLDKVLADLGIGTRKELKQLIRSGRVNVNGETVSDPGMHVDPEQDELSFHAGDWIRIPKDCC